ncbi:MAG: NAD-dependent epimerase/dehydratase family protein [Oceanicaulis sp.]
MAEMTYDTAKPVLVTGATGFVAGWLVKQLLELGYTVHAAVRSPDDEAKRSHLDALAGQTPGAIRYFKADLNEPGSFDAAAEGCSVIFHTASPFTSKISDPQTDLVDPAVNGTRTVLEAANKAQSVERVVLTSSCAAIYGDNQDVADAPGACLTEAVWNTTSSLDHQAYSYSKTQAERAAWDMAKAQDRWRLVVVNPSFILGPSLNEKPTSESFAIVRQLADGSMKTGAPPYEIGAVDVRDVADAHVRAAFIPEAEGRHITSAVNTSLLGLAERLRDQVGEGPFPTRELPKFMVWLVGPMMNKMLTRKMISRNMGHAFCADNTKSKRALGMEYRDIAPGLGEMHAQLKAAGKV